MNNHLSRVRAILDIGFVAGLVFALLLSEKIVAPLIVVGIIPIPFLLGRLRGKPMAVPLTRLLVPAGAYFGYSLVVYFFFPGLRADEPRPINPSIELYAVAIAMLAVGVVRGLEVERLRARFHLVAPWSLVISFAILSGLMFLGYRSECRVFAGASWPFIPALIFSTLSFLLLLGWRDFTRFERNLRLVLIALAVVVVTAYTGARGIGLAQAGVLAMFFILGFLPRFRNQLPSPWQIAAATIGGAALCTVVALATGCGSTDRLVSIFKTAVVLSESQPLQTSPSPAVGPTAAGNDQAQPPTSAPAPATAINPAPAAPGVTTAISDVSINIRLEMWKTSITSIAEAPLFGHGALFMKRLIAGKFGAEYEHNHNQYLSWMVTGGILALGLGLLFISMPWLMSVGLQPADRIVIALSISLFWGISMIFDSFMNLKFYLHYYCLLSGLLYALVNDMLIGSSPVKGQK